MNKPTKPQPLTPGTRVRVVPLHGEPFDGVVLCLGLADDVAVTRADGQGSWTGSSARVTLS